ncbi:cytochrome P450 [Gloeopeniophorella convolvens]|nr:cytochrome P450 [Gloeopeniophorella convolvens]
MFNISKRLEKWKRVALQHYERHIALFKGLLTDVQDGISKGSERPSTSTYLQEFRREWAFQSGDGPSYRYIICCFAGATAISISWWLLVMAAFPRFQKHAQEELDAVVGRTRVPTFADAKRLPYVQAMVKGTPRWRPPLPLLIPHSTTQDSWYEGMFIPKGTMCLSNLWHCNHDHAVFGEDADMFNPERYLDVQREPISGPAEARSGHSTYGFGRRASIGARASGQ